jgi:hypothetical protein
MVWVKEKIHGPYIEADTYWNKELELLLSIGRYQNRAIVTVNLTSLSVNLKGEKVFRRTNVVHLEDSDDVVRNQQLCREYIRSLMNLLDDCEDARNAHFYRNR